MYRASPPIFPARLVKCGTLLALLATPLALSGCSKPLPEAIRHCQSVASKIPDMHPGTGEEARYANIINRKGDFIMCMKNEGYVGDRAHENALRDHYRKVNNRGFPRGISEFYHESSAQLYKDMDNPDSGYWKERDPISYGCFFTFCP